MISLILLLTLSFFLFFLLSRLLPTSYLPPTSFLPPSCLLPTSLLPPSYLPPTCLLPASFLPPAYLLPTSYLPPTYLLPTSYLPPTYLLPAPSPLFRLALSFDLTYVVTVFYMNLLNSSDLSTRVLLTALLDRNYSVTV